MRIAITGASGLIGAAVAARLARDGEVVTIGRREDCDLKADLSEPAVAAELDLRGCDLLVHAAGIVDEDFRADAAKAFRQATAGASALFAAAAASGVRRVAYVSSAHVYGPLVGEIDERTAPDPRSDYAIAHFATEQSLKRMSAQFHAAAAFRPCAVYGQPPVLSQFRRWGLIPFDFPRQAIERQAIRLNSSGEQSRNFVAADDIAQTISSWSSIGPEGWSTCNPVGASDLTVWEFARLCAAVAEAQTAKAVDVTRPDGPHAPAAVLRYGTRTAFGAGRTDIREAIGALTRRLMTEGA